MAGSIVESVMSLLGPNVAGPIASQLGESTETVQRGLQSGSAAILSGVAAKVDEPGFMGQIFGMITNPANTPSALTSLISNPGAVVSGASGSTISDLGSRFLSSVFGARLPAVTDAIGQSSGLSSGKAGMLMSMAAPLVLGALGQHVRESGSSATDLASKLKSEASGLTRFLPAGLSSLLGGVPGYAAAAAAAPVAAAKAGSRWLGPVILLAVLLLGLLWFFNRAKAPVGEAVQTVSNAGASAVSALGQFFATKLPDGVELNIPQFGVENKLIAFLNDSSKPVDDTTWFNFDRLLFDTGSATLQPSSQEQLGNIAAILKAYPNVHLKIGGYTDNTGDAAANMSLSAARAKNVMDALVNSGIDASRLSSQGYGEQFPVGDNSTEAGRAQNRRIAMRVTQK
ncbi:MAG TPA: OmpA family protein [Edaphobacter sp.]|nr:OmpA family protein [Edaphobacter sp.]